MSSSLDDIYSLLKLIDNKIDKIEDNVFELNHKLHRAEEDIKQLVSGQNPSQGQVTIVSSISTSEEKIKLLNKQTKPDTQDDLIQALESRCVIETSGIYSIIKEQITIYEYASDILYNFDSESSCKYFYGFPDSKNILYYWNNSKTSWCKMTKSYLENIFMLIQNKIIIKYNILMNEDKNLKKGSVDNGELIYVDNFEKKYNDFKKDLFSKLV